MPTGWRPADVVEAHPVLAIENVFQQDKYDSRPSRFLLHWGWLQLGLSVLLMFLLFNRMETMSFPNILVYSLFLFVCIFSYTALLDKAPYALGAEIVRTVLGFGLLWWYGGWFGLEADLPFSTALAIFLLAGSLLGSGYFYFVEVGGRASSHFLFGKKVV